MKLQKNLGEDSLVSLMAAMAIPSVIAQVINILYNIIDRIYIGHIPGVGTSALTGVGLTFPILTLISAFSTFSSTGGASLASIWLGKGEKEHAEKILGSSVYLLLIFTAALMAVFYFFHVPFLYLFGASDETIGYASSYLTIYLVGTLFVELALGLNTFIIIQGHSRIAMGSVLIGAVLNCILDPIFIFVLGWGVRGAAIATVISQFVSACWTVSFLCRKKTELRIRRNRIRWDGKIIGPIVSLGISPFIMRSTESLISIVMNRQLQIYGGDLYVGSLTIMQSVMQFMSAPLAGFTQGVQPIISYNYGAEKFDRVRKTYRAMITISTCLSFFTTSMIMLFPAAFASLFTSDRELIGLVAKVMPMFFTGMLIFGIQQGIQPTFLALGQAKISLFIAMLRKVILLVPLAIVFPHFFGVMGVYYAEPVSDTISAITAAVLFFTQIRKILSKEALNKIR